MTGRSHGVTSEALQCIFLHGDERSPVSPAGIALRVGEILRCNHHITNRRLRPAGKNATDLRSTRGGWRSNDERAVRSNRGQHIAIVRGKDKKIRCDLGDTYSGLERNQQICPSVQATRAGSLCRGIYVVAESSSHGLYRGVAQHFATRYDMGGEVIEKSTCASPPSRTGPRSRL